MIERRVIAVEGIVQGVGFRPYVHRLATSRKLDGSVRNGPAGLVIDVQGDRAALDDFLHALTAAPPPTPEWGAMINDARPFILSEPQLMVIPGLAISASVAGFNLLGDALRDVLDPRRNG